MQVEELLLATLDQPERGDQMNLAWLVGRPPVNGPMKLPRGLTVALLPQQLPRMGAFPGCLGEPNVGPAGWGTRLRGGVKFDGGRASLEQRRNTRDGADHLRSARPFSR